MQTLNKYSFLLAVLVLVSSCQVFEATKSSDRGSAVDENLSAYRPTYSMPSDSAMSKTSQVPAKQVQGKPAQPIGPKLDAMLAEVAEGNKKYTKAPGYRIQVYTGGSRTDANKAKELVYSNHPDASVHMEYKQPIYTVRVGNYFDRINAQPLYVSLKQDFGNVLVVPDNIEITDKLFQD